jgi:sialate O-acetylesterase
VKASSGKAALLALGLVGAITPVTAAELAQVFGNHMVLQRDQAITIRGRGEPREEVTVTLADVARTGVADASGAWQVVFPAMPVGGPHRLTLGDVQSPTQAIDDVLVGDLWLCSGQSNMYFPVSQTSFDLSAETIRHPMIRLMTVEQKSEALPQARFGQKPAWSVADSESVRDFSAVCYFFARELQRVHAVPLGLVHASWGGSAIEAWMSRDALEQAGGFDERLELLRSFVHDEQQAAARFAAGWEAWWRDTTPAADLPWQGTERDAADWSALPAMRNWKTLGDPSLAEHNGMVWFRTSLRLTAEQARQEATLALGRIDEVDVTWINGRFVGTEFGWGTERTYGVPRNVLRAGENRIVVNVLSTWGDGGMVGPAEAVELRFAGGDVLPIAERWEYRKVPAEYGMPPRAPWEPIAGISGLFNGMLAPLEGLRFAGALWYQGESNAGDAAPYANLLSSMIDDWRKRFNESLAFLVVQLPNFGDLQAGPVESGWAAIRDAQRRVAVNDPLSGLVVTVDVGDYLDLHPPNKLAVGRRAADVARSMTLADDGVIDGVSPSRAVREGGEVIVVFDPAVDELVVIGDGKPAAFELCTAKSCVYADARLDGHRVFLSAKAARAATRVRYCWADAPICNLYGASGLPVSSFELPIDETRPRFEPTAVGARPAGDHR